MYERLSIITTITVTGGSSRLFSNTSSRQLVQSILDQNHLSPSTTHIQLILAEYDHAMRLYPLHACVHIPFLHSYHARNTSRGGPTSLTGPFPCFHKVALSRSR